jgi:CubicO group peptidase (beta-lactamase class C family)
VDAGETVTSRLAAVLDTLVPAELRATRTPGAAVAVVIGDSVVYAKGFGVASVETGEAVTAATLFRIASTTKMLTGAAVLSAAERGILAIDRPVGGAMTGLAPGLARIPIRDLLRHNAGLRESSSYYGPHDDAALPAFVRAWSDTVFFTSPGEVYSYSNLGYVLAGAALGEASGRPYADAMRDLLFRPLGMDRSTLRPTEAMTWPLAQGHELGADDLPRVVRPFSDDARYWPAGSVFTSAAELARFVVAMVNDGRVEGRQAMPARVVRELLARQTDVPANPPGQHAGYTYGLIVRDVGGNRVYQHGGVRVGFGSLVRIVPTRRFGIVILANRTDAVLVRTLERATELVVGAAPAAAPAAPPRALTPSEVAWAAGRYVNAPGELELELVAVEAELRLRAPGRPPEDAPRVLKMADGRYQAGGQTFALVSGADGSARYLAIAGRALRRR